MGYYTYYKLNTRDWKDEDFAAFNKIRSDNCFYPFDANGEPKDSYKWYEHESDMKWLSSLRPETLFILEGFGEENEDIWRAFCLGGKFYKERAQIVMPEFDETKLK